MCRIEQLAIFFGNGRQRKLAISKIGRRKTGKEESTTLSQGATAQGTKMDVIKIQGMTGVIPRWH